MRYRFTHLCFMQFFYEMDMSKEHVIGVIAHANILHTKVIKLFELFIPILYVYVSLLSMVYLSVHDHLKIDNVKK